MSVRQVTRKRGDRVETFWIVDVDYQHADGRRERVRRVPRVQTRRAAEQLEREVVNALAAGTFGRKEAAPEPVATFEAFAKTFVETYAETNNKPSEIDSKRQILRQHLVPAFGTLALDGVTVERIEGYKAAKLRAKLAPKTINNHLAVLSKLLTVAVEWRKIAAAPAVKWLAAPEPEFDFFDFDEADRLIAAAGDWAAMVTVALRAGLRLGELIGLRWQDVDLKAGRLVVRQAVARGKVGTPKSGKKREVPLGAEALAALKAHRHLKSEFVFCGAAGAMLTKGETKRPLWSACKRAGLRLVGWHVLRHTFASQLAMRGAPMRAIQELMGHATMEMTLRYAHLSPDARREAVRLLDGVGRPHGNLTATSAEREKN